MIPREKRSMLHASSPEHCPSRLMTLIFTAAMTVEGGNVLGTARTQNSRVLANGNSILRRLGRLLFLAIQLLPAPVDSPRAEVPGISEQCLNLSVPAILQKQLERAVLDAVECRSRSVCGDSWLHQARG